MQVVFIFQLLVLAVLSLGGCGEKNFSDAALFQAAGAGDPHIGSGLAGGGSGGGSGGGGTGFFDPPDLPDYRQMVADLTYSQEGQAMIQSDCQSGTRYFVTEMARRLRNIRDGNEARWGRVCNGCDCNGRISPDKVAYVWGPITEQSKLISYIDIHVDHCLLNTPSWQQDNGQPGDPGAPCVTFQGL
jgi:hypothetical protein